jgi:hypothetical protein
VAEKEDFKTILERRPTWDFLQNLPREIHGFRYVDGGQVDGHVLTLCSYVMEEEHRSLDLIYTKETFDYLPVKNVGLHRFRDVRYITRSRQEFEQVIPQVLPRILEELLPTYMPSCKPMLEKKGILQWEYWKTLPKQIGGFQLFLTPERPLEFINNSTIFLDYVDFARSNELVFLYNRVRNEFFAEIKEASFPGTIHDFDAQSLKQLESILTPEHLADYLGRLDRGEIEKA